MDTRSLGFLLVLGTALVTSATAVAAPAVIVTDSSKAGVFGSVGVPTYYTGGFQFTPLEDISVSELGIWANGSTSLTHAHAVGLWTDGGTLLASVAIPAGGGVLSDGFAYLDITPTELTAGSEYRIGATYVSDDTLDKLVYDYLPLGAFSFDPAIELDIAASTFNTTGPTLDFPSTLGWYNIGFPAQQGMNFGPNFQFSAVPEPATLALLGITFAAIGFARRRLM